MSHKYGIMQGRLSKIDKGKIQSFPKRTWKNEFSKANKLGLKFIEWTLDYDDLDNNPIFSKKGQNKIKQLSKKYSIKINSLTGDCFMQKPFWKLNSNDKLIYDLIKIITSCKTLGIKFIVIPLVDNGSINTNKELNKFIKICKNISKYLLDTKIKLIFESDYPPKKLKNFMNKFDARYFGINYDVGNSASLNYDIDKEFNYYGKYICNIHIKDRLRNGKTIRLGMGNANFSKLFYNLKKIKYEGNLILQTARSENQQHMNEIKKNLNFLKNFNYA